MGMILRMMKEFKEINNTENGIIFTKEGFEQLHDEVLKGLDTAEVTGIAKGIFYSGLVVVGVGGYKYIRNEIKSRKEDDEV